MRDLVPFAVVALLAGFALVVAVASNRLSQRLSVPAPALFLVVASGAAYLAPRLAGVPVVVDQRIVTVALVVILFDGGMRIGWTRMRTAAGAVVWLGLVGTIVTAGALTLAAHYFFGFDWRPALLIGAALAPTDPAVVFSVLGRKEIAGRSGTLLEGESGANDPVAIAVMVSLLGAGGNGWSALGSGVATFALQLGLGAVVGLLGGWLLLRLLRRLPPTNPALQPIQTFGLALAMYGAAASLDGSGFLAVFLAGVMVGDARVPHRHEIDRVGGALAGLAEIVAFVVLGLSVDLSSVFDSTRIGTAIGLAALLIIVVRPLLVGLVLWPIRLARGERLFVLFAGLKGAVPILLGTYVLVEGEPRAGDIYAIVYVVVLISVLVQGGLVPTMARIMRVPMRVL